MSKGQMSNSDDTILIFEMETLKTH